MFPTESFEQSFQSVDKALGEIEHTLEQMLALARLSASDLNVDRNALQKTLERLQRKIDRIADTLGPSDRLDTGPEHRTLTEGSGSGEKGGAAVVKPAGTGKVEQEEVQEVTGYRYSATGVFGYEFYEGRQKLCAVSSLAVPSPPVQMCGYGLNWKSGFDRESTVVPGLTRYVCDESGAVVSRLVYRACGEYEIDGSVLVRCGEGSFLFFREGKVVAQIGRYRGEAAWLPESVEFDCEAWFTAKLGRELSDAQRLLILSFPMLRFGF